MELLARVRGEPEYSSIILLYRCVCGLFADVSISLYLSLKSADVSIFLLQLCIFSLKLSQQFSLSLSVSLLHLPKPDIFSPQPMLVLSKLSSQLAT